MQTKWYCTKKNPKDVIRKLLEFIDVFVKIAGNKIVYSVAFLYTNNKRSESEGNNPIYHHIKVNKIPRKAYLKRQKTLKTLKMLMKEMKMTQTDGKIHCVLGLEESILSKWLYYPRQSTDSIPFLLPMAFYTELEWKNLKNYHGNTEDPR